MLTVRAWSPPYQLLCSGPRESASCCAAADGRAAGFASVMMRLKAHIQPGQRTEQIKSVRVAVAICPSVEKGADSGVVLQRVGIFQVFHMITKPVVDPLGKRPGVGAPEVGHKRLGKRKKLLFAGTEI